MRSESVWRSGLGRAIFVVALCECVPPEDLCDRGMCSSPAVVTVVPGCEKSPREDASVLRDECAVFVVKGGAGDGTKGSPLGKIQEGIVKAIGDKKYEVFVCGSEGSYDEALSVTSQTDGVRVYGGFQCPGNAWSYTSGVKAKVAPTKAGVAVKVDTVSLPVLFEDMEIGGAKGDAGFRSSVGVFATSAKDVTLRRVKVVAGEGFSGANGVLDSYTFPGAVELRGHGASGNGGADEKECTCPGGSKTKGGRGGTGKAGSANPTDGEAGTPALQGGAGGTAGASCSPSGGGSDGASAPVATSGAGATTWGVLGASGWEPYSGEGGQEGSPGQGGGGGGGGATSGGGGSGGCGACGGAAGGAGQGGGGSIAVLLFGSVAKFEESELLTGTAGAGGKGADGQAGQSVGGNGGDRGGDGCLGGKGGAGASGGAGGSGAGGISMGVVYKQSTLTLDAATEAKIVPGLRGVGGRGNKPGTDGISGKKLDAP